MTVTVATASRTTLCDTLVDLLDVGSTNATARMLFKTSGGTLLCTNNMTNPAFGAAASGVATAAAISQGTVPGAIAAQTIARCEFTDRNNTEIFRCAVAVSASDINLTSIVVSTGDTIDVTALTVTVP